MGTPVEVADELAEAARETAELANRSMAKQIEHWARVGRAVEELVKSSDVLALKAHLSKLSDRAALIAAHGALRRLADALQEQDDPSASRAAIFETGEPVYEAVRGRPDRVAKVFPDGRSVVGRFVERDFIPDEPETANTSSSS